MDPEVAYRLMTAAWRRADYATAWQRADDLTTWMRRGGRAPLNVPDSPYWIGWVHRFYAPFAVGA